MDGYVTIGTELNTKDFDKKYEKLKSKLERENITLGVKADEVEKQQQEIAILETELERINQEEKKINSSLIESQKIYDSINAKIKEGQELTTGEFLRYDRIENELIGLKEKHEQILAEQQNYNGEWEKVSDKLTKVEASYDIQKNKVEEATNELRLYESTQEMIEKHSSNIGNSLEKIVKKVKKWTLAIFGVRSAYMFIRQAMSTLSQSDEQLATNIEYIKWALATTVKPIIEWIVKAVYTVLSLIGSLVKAIFGVNIFANATADAFKKQKNAMNGTNKEAKQLQKTLAGFDEMNVLQENGTTTPGGGGGGFTPEIDLGNLENPSFIKKLKRFWSDIFDFWEKDWKDVFNSVGGNWGNFIQGLILTVKGFWDVLKGIGELIIGLVQMIVGLVTGNFELVKQGFNIMIEGIKNILIGALEIITGLLLTVFGFVKGIFLEIWDFIYKYLILPVTNAFSGLINIVKKPFTAIVDAVKGLWDKIKKPIEELVKKINKALDKINPINLWDDIKSGAKSGWNKVKSFFGFAKGGIVYNNLPKLASGGVINQPGRGVPIASAVGGERGAEGVIPLTDSQQMALLGEAIGRYVNISATIPVYVGNRKVAREVRKIQANEDFAFNR